MNGEVISIIGYAISVAALVALIAGAAVRTNMKSKKNR